MKIKSVILICILFLAGNLVWAQPSLDPPVEFTEEIPKRIHPRWTSHVNSNYIHDLIIDGNFLWIVGGGVKQYNLTNNNCIFYYTEHGLASNDTRAIAADDKFIWVATAAGVSRYSKEEEKWKNFYPSDGLADEVVTSLAIDKTRRQLWFGTWENGVSRFDIEKESWRTFKSFNGAEGDPVISIALDNEDNAVWFGTWENGLGKLDLKTGEWKIWNQKNGLPQNAVTSIAMDGECVWIGTMSAGACRYHKGKDQWEYFNTQNGMSGDWVSSIVADPLRKNIWFSTRDGGLCKFQRDTNQWESILINEQEIDDTTSIVLHGDSIFAGTWGDGFWKFDFVSNRWKNFSAPIEISHNRVVNIISDTKNNIIWFGTEGGGASSYDLRRDCWKQYNVENGFLPNDVVNKIAIDQSRQTIWFGTDAGIVGYKLEPELNKSFRALENELVYSVFPAKTKLWAGTYRDGLYYLDHATDKWNEFFSLPRSTYYSIVVDEQKGKIWGGTNQGVVVYDEKSSQQVSIDNEEILPKVSIRNIFLDKAQNVVWLGSWGAGLFRFNIQSKKWKKYTVKNGLPSNYALGITNDSSDPDVLWVATDRGVAKYDLEKNQWKIYTPYDGLSHILTLCVAVYEDSVWIGTWGGGVSRYRLRR